MTKSEKMNKILDSCESLKKAADSCKSLKEASRSLECIEEHAIVRIREEIGELEEELQLFVGVFENELLGSAEDGKGMKKKMKETRAALQALVNGVLNGDVSAGDLMRAEKILDET